MLTVLATVLLTIPSHAKLHHNVVPEGTTTILQCDILNSQSEQLGDLMIFSGPRAGKTQVLDIATSPLDVGFNGLPKSIVEANGVFDITLKKNAGQTFTINTAGGALTSRATGEKFELRECHSLIKDPHGSRVRR